MALYQGPGTNLDFYLITTGLNIDPDHGTMGLENYNHLKNVIQQRAEIHYENEVIRRVENEDPSPYLLGYPSEQRDVYQILFGLSEHHNGWNVQTLTAAIDTAYRNQNLNPQDGFYSIDFEYSRNQGFTAYQAKNSGSGLTWVKNSHFFYSYEEPNFAVGNSGDVWLVIKDNKIIIWYKFAYTWYKLSDWVKEQNPQGTIHYQNTSPTESENSWWIDTTGLTLRKFDKEINSWGSIKGVTVSSTQPVAPSVGDLWLKRVTDGLELFEFNGSRFQRAQLSQYPVRTRDTNSFFVGETNDNNFIIEDQDQALLGGILYASGVSDMVENYDIQVTANGQTSFMLPSNASVVLDFGVNGIETTAFSYDPNTNILTFDPVAANYSLEIGDKIHILYRSSS